MQHQTAVAIASDISHNPGVPNPWVAAQQPVKQRSKRQRMLTLKRCLRERAHTHTPRHLASLSQNAALADTGRSLHEQHTTTPARSGRQRLTNDLKLHVAATQNRTAATPT
jgi:hypothetical protein